MHQPLNRGEVSPRWQFGEFELDLVAFKLRRGASTLAVEPKALDVLQLLIERAPRVVDKGEIFASVWKGVAVTDNALTRVVAQLRKVLDDDPRAPRFVETVATRGYRFIATVTPVVETAAPVLQPASPPEPWRRRATSPSKRPGSRRLLAIAAALGVVAVAGGLWLAASRSGAAPVSASWLSADGIPNTALLATIRPEQITTGQGYDGFLAYSPDGLSVAFSSDRSGTLEIYVQSLAAGATATALTSNGRQNVQPAWSPDGQYIAYHEMAGDGVWIVPSRGGVSRKVSDVGSFPVWSPDGARLAFQSLPTNELYPFGVPGALGNILSVNVSGPPAVVPLTRFGEPAGPHLHPEWLDDTRIVFVTGSLGENTLFSTDVQASRPAAVASAPELTANYVLTPDRRGVFFVARDTTAIWYLPLSGDDETRTASPTGLQTFGSKIGQLTVSRDGRRLAWTAIDTSDHIWVRPDAHAAIVAPVQITKGLNVRFGLPAASSDGRILTVRNRPGAAQSVFLVTPGAEPRQLTTHPELHSGPRWMPGEREAILIADHDDVAGFWAFDLDTGRERLLFRLTDLPKPDGATQPSTAAPSTNTSFAPDFSRLVMGIVKDGVQNLWVAGLQAEHPDGTLRQLTFEREGGSYPVWSPNGRWIAYQCNEGMNTHACVVDVASGERTQLTHHPGQSWAAGWSPDSAQVLFAAQRDSVWNVAAVTLTDETTRLLTHFTGPAGYVRYPRWNPAIRGVVFERSVVTGRVWQATLPEKLSQ